MNSQSHRTPPDLDRPASVARPGLARGRRRGSILSGALLALSVASILIAPMLMRQATGYAVDQRHVQTLREQYAADAAVEYGVQRIRHDAALDAQLLAQIGTPIALALPAPVNTVSPTLQVTLVQTQPLVAEWTWAIWADQEVLIEKNNTVINGDVHCNGPVTITGNNTEINGDVEQNTYAPCPVSWSITDFRPGGTHAVAAATEGRYHYHAAADWSPSAADDLLPGLHYCTGNVVIDDNGVNGENVTVVADGVIHFTKNKNAYLSPYVPGLSFFSNSPATDAILVDGNKLTSAGGVLYAPNGTIDLAGNNATVDGAILVAKRVAITKNDAIIQMPLEVNVAGPIAGACYTFDVRGVAGDTQVDSRIRFCPGEMQVLSWAMQ